MEAKRLTSKEGSRRVRFEGAIVAAGFETGDRVVTGVWHRGPFGAMTDVMWQQPDDHRILIAPSEKVARFVAGVYEFDEVRVEPTLACEITRQHVALDAGELTMRLSAGRPMPLFALRPRWLRRAPAWVRIEDAVFRPLVARLIQGASGVRTYGVTRTGVREWYAVDSYRPITSGSASIGGIDAGDLALLEPPVTFGFSAFPSRPALVRCAPILEGDALPGLTGDHSDVADSAG